MSGFLSRLLSSDDHSVELHLFLGAIGTLTFLGLEIFQVIWRRVPFDMNAFGQGIGLTFVGTGAAAWGQGLQRRWQAKP